MKKSKLGWVVIWVDSDDQLTQGAPGNSYNEWGQEWFPTFEEAEAALMEDLEEFEAQGFAQKFLIVQGYLYQSENGKQQNYER